ncbi:MAG TPA: ankyrin repeat domain-containing protein [Gammaproteobacteria bacterium]|jgi:hypothetical protein|nr:ankyrin repeat domain-containing protein [Gammaproteobacteria bacterium]
MHLPIIRELRSYGALLGPYPDGASLFAIPIKSDRVDIVGELLNGASISDQRYIRYELIYAIMCHKVESVREFLKHGVNINYQSSDGDVPLVVATQFNSIEVVRVLLEHKANSEYQDRNSNTALMIAASDGRINILQELLKHGAKIDFQNRNGNTARMSAVFSNQISAVQELLAYNARVDFKDAHDRTALSIADNQIASLIKENLKERETYEAVRKEIKLVFSGKNHYRKNMFFQEIKPVFYLPEALVDIVDGYLKLTSSPP